MNKSKQLERKTRKARPPPPRLSPPPEPPFAPPEFWVSKLEKLVKERDQILAHQGRLLSERASLFPNWEAQRQKFQAQRDDTLGHLQKSCHDYTNLFDFAPVGYVVLDAQGLIKEINKTAAQLIGFSHASLVRRFLTAFVVREDIRKLLAHLHLCRSSRQNVTSELRLRQTAGPPLPVALVTAPFEDPIDRFTQYRTAIIDIRPRLETEAALDEVQQYYRLLIDSIQGIVWEGRAHSDSWRFTFVSNQAEQVLGYPAQRWLLEPDFWEHRLHSEDRASVLKARADAVRESRNHVLEYRICTAERRILWVRDSVTVKQGTGHTRLEGILINITELKDLETALRRSNQELEVRVAQRTATLARTCVELNNEILERKRLEHELLDLTESGRHEQGVDAHGQVGQSLAGISFMVKSLGTKLEKTSPPEAAQAEAIQSVVEQTMAQTHDPAHALVSFGMQEESLPLALKGLAARAETLFDIPCRFKPNGPISTVDHDVATQFYSIAQEAVIDALKYGKAGQVIIALSRKDDRLILTVQYHGQPFPTPLHHSLELGIKIMNYRANVIGAALEITEQEEQGPLVTCTFPAKPKEKGRLVAEKV